MYIFGSGNAYATPYGASAPANPSPLELGVLQETTVDFSNSQKELYGKLQYPLAIARTEGKVDIKFKFANVYLKLWNDLFFGSSVSAGEEIGAADVLSTLTSHTVTITPPSSGVFARNLGVRVVATGKQMTLVTSGTEVAGVSYSIAAAVYTFATGEAATVFISYTYTITTNGFKSNVTNLAMGTQPTLDVTIFNAQYANLDGSVNCLLRFPAVIAGKMTLPMKNEDWLLVEFDCGAFADTANNIMYLNADE